tara:strand:+ start:190 stop:390 length:201 start_codon:yes stop_codon:yes gene_type:complete
MNLYNTDYLLKNKEGDFERFKSGDYIIYSSACRVDEVMVEGDSWVKTTDLEPKIKNELINQLKEIK